ncbi:MAG: leucine-rich repeat domain-containing protein [Bacteroidales bacterium]|nr:leucine-rich repeat domain-containing protein [Bacteroidales bacterium]MBQ8811361.1 leucine-rich repeat domain-containing protein [Bacteroidales bacterium]
MIQEKEIDGIWYRLNVNDQEAVVIKSKGEEYSGKIVIPSSFFHEGITYFVTQIAEHAFEFCLKVTSITIPSSIKKTGEHSFYYFGSEYYDVSLDSIESFCRIDFGVIGNPIHNANKVFINNEKITHLTIPGTIQIVSEDIFYNCNFESITIEEGVVEIAENAFRGSSIKSISLPKTLETIGDSAFESCSDLKSVIGGEKVRYIGNNTFSNCKRLEIFEIKDCLEKIGNAAFEYCKCLSMEIPPKLRTLGAWAFRDSWLSIDIPDCLINIDKYAFAGCKLDGAINVDPFNPNYDSREGCNAVIETKTNTLIRASEETIIPKSVRVIGEYSFSDLHYLPSIVIPEGVVRIEDNAFNNCYRLREIDIPSTLVSIGSAFTNCCNIDVRINNLEAWCNIEFGCNPLSMGRWYEGYVGHPKTSFLYLNGEIISDLIIPSSITCIKNSTFKRCYLESVNIPNTVTSIGDEAFLGCSHMASILIPKQVTDIGTGAFAGCEDLTFLTILGNPRIQNGVFAGCEGLKDVYCYSDEAPIADEAFGKLNLSAITLHVPSEAVNNYKNLEPWSKFGSIVPLK